MTGAVIQAIRETPLSERTHSLRRMNKRETEVNHHYWSFKVIADYSGYIARNFEQVDPEKLTKDIFCATGLDANRLPRTVSDWLIAKVELESWLCSSALVSASSYFERYLAEVSSLSVRSYPYLRDNRTLRVDGVRLLRLEVGVETKPVVEALTKGDWNARVAAYRNFFGNPPATLVDNVRILEGIRRRRNDIAHAFGRSIDELNDIEIDHKPAKKLTFRTLKRYLQTISKCAAAIDNHLLSHHILNFECFLIYHEWKKGEPDRGMTSWEKRFKKHLQGTHNVHCSLLQARNIIKYYDQS